MVAVITRSRIKILEFITAAGAAMFGLWYISLAIDEFRKRMGWDSIFDIFRGGKSSNRKAIPAADNLTKKDEINGSIKSDKDNVSEVPNDDNNNNNIKSIIKNVPKGSDVNKPISEKSINDDKPKVPAFTAAPDKSTTPIDVPKIPESFKKSTDIPKVPELIPKLPTESSSKPDAKINIPKEPVVVPEQSKTSTPLPTAPSQTTMDDNIPKIPTAFNKLPADDSNITIPKSPIDISTKPKIIDNLPKTPAASPSSPSQQFNGSGIGNIAGNNTSNRTNDFIENQKTNLPKTFENGNTTTTTASTTFDNKNSDIKDATNAFLSEESSTPRMKPAVPPKRYKQPQNLPQ